VVGAGLGGAEPDGARFERRAFRRVVGELQRPPVGAAGAVDAADPAEQVGRRRVERLEPGDAVVAGKGVEDGQAGGGPRPRRRPRRRG
jgi:hypothetical protein